MQAPDFSTFTAALAASDGPQKAFDALCELTKNHVGTKLFTVMIHDARTGDTSRVYSNMPTAYPVSGTKPVNETDWSRQVIREKRTFVANDIKAIADVFDDYRLIKSLGCESVINVPIFVAGQFKGTINCLHEVGFYTPGRVAAAEALKLPGAVCLLLNEMNAMEGG